jgi:hypothetical protein
LKTTKNTTIISWQGLEYFFTKLEVFSFSNIPETGLYI